MRRFIFCRGLYTIKEMDSIESGEIGVYTLTNRGFKLLKQDVVPTEIMNIVVGRKNENGGNIVVPIHKNAFSYSLMSYQAHKAYSAEVVVTAPAVAGDYTIIVAKKGVNFNERNKWTATVHVSDNDIEANMTAAQLAEKLADAINGNNTVSKKLTVVGNTSSGVKATLNTATITITAIKAGVDYKVLTADNLITVKPTETPAVIGRASTEYIKELANKAAADAGFTDTFEEDIDMYKNYPFDPNVLYEEHERWDIFTIKFAEPRAMKTVDQVVNQIVQIVVESGTSVNVDLKAVFDAIISGKAVDVNRPE